VTVIDGATNQVITSVVVGYDPLNLCYNSKDDKVYCANYMDTSVTVIDGATNQVIATVPVENVPQALCFNSFDGKVYCGDEGRYPDYDSLITVIDGVSNQVVATIVAGTEPHTISYNSRENKLYCANYESNTVTVIDGSSDSVIATVAVGINPRINYYNPQNNKVYCLNANSNNVSIIDGASNRVLKTIAVGLWPHEAAYNPVQNRMYISDGNTLSSISVIRDSMTGIGECEESGVAAKSLTVSSNPVRGRSSIRFRLTEQGRVKLSIRDVAGHSVAVLSDGVMKPGVYSHDWVVAPTVPAGIYFLDLKTPIWSETRKLVLAR
jgi:YVTN family beta-propeller protein